MLTNQFAHIVGAADLIRASCNTKPRVGIVLGSGLSGLANSIVLDAVIEGEAIPHYPKSTAIGHKGRVLLGQLGGEPVVAIDGRPHSYEGHSFYDVAFPTQLMIELGIQTLLVSNASGAVNPSFNVGDVMVIEDHINLMWDNPLIGKNRDEVGPRFPDMSSPYDAELNDLAIELSRDASIGVHRGVYLAMAGPTYETRAEYRMARLMGADVVGMSTVPEIIVAGHAGIRCAALSVVSNVFDPDSTLGTTGDEVVEIVARSEPIVRDVVQGLVARSN
jgi:purine-nucleoside phosphorylase